MSENVTRPPRAIIAGESRRDTTRTEMLEEAMNRPGIREIMKVYEDWRVADQGLESYRLATREPRTITTTNHANM